MADIEHGQGEQLHKKQDQVATDKDNPFEILFEDIVTIENETTQLKKTKNRRRKCLRKITVMGNTKEPSHNAQKVKKMNCPLESIHLKSKRRRYTVIW